MRKISSLTYELIMGEVLCKSACASRKEARGGDCLSAAGFFSHNGGKLCYTTGQTIQQLCVQRIVGSRVRFVAADMSEKLAQEGLRRDRDRLAVGERIRAGVRKVTHDLKGVCGSRRFLHCRNYQTSASARMVNTKLAYPLEWYNGFHNLAGEKSPLFLPLARRRGRGWKGEAGNALQDT